MSASAGLGLVLAVASAACAVRGEDRFPRLPDAAPVDADPIRVDARPAAAWYETDVPSFDRHVFVCTNERAADHPRGSCKARGGVEVRELLKKELTVRGLAGRVRANAAGCLDQCERGVTLVVYPEQVWYAAVTPADVTEIIERHLVGGQIVERLRMPDQPHLGAPLPPLAAT